ncbi:MAG: caspase family protein [Calditrichaceae bacterium]
MHRKSISIKIFLVFILISAFFQPAAAADSPEVFVQTGHANGVKLMAVSPDGRFLVSAETLGYQKLWDISSGRELRTIKFGDTVHGLEFIDTERFIILGADKGEIFNSAGEKLETLSLPVLSAYGKKSVTPNLKYLCVDNSLNGSGEITLFDIKDGSKIRLPEDRDDYSSPLLDLGCGFFGFFYDSYRDDKSDINLIGNTAYVIYDQELNVRKRGLIKGQIYIGAQLKVDNDLKYVYKNLNFNDNSNITVYDLDTGTAVRTLPGKKGAQFELVENKIFTSMIRLRGDGGKSVYDIDFTVYELLGNGGYKEKKMLFTDLNILNPFKITPRGQIILNKARDLNNRDYATDLELYDINAGKEVRKFGVKPIVYQQVAYENGRLLNIEKSFHRTDNIMKVWYKYNIWNAKTAGLEVFEYSHSTEDVYQDRNNKWIIRNAKDFYRQVPAEFFADPYEGRYKEYYDSAVGYPIFFKSSSGDILNYKLDAIFVDATYISVERKSDKTEVARFYAFSDGEWIVITPEGYFNASPNGAKYINVRIGNQVYSIDNFYEKFYNPLYVAAVLQGTEARPVADIRAGVALPPQVRIISPETNAEFKSEQVAITITAKDMGGGIDEIRLYHNDKAIGEETRGVKLTSKIAESTKTYNVMLVDGINTFRAVGFSRDRTESNPSEIVIKLLAPEKETSMYVLSVGINGYKNPALDLNYAEPDAKAVAEFFRTGGTGLFKKVVIKDVYNELATKEGILLKMQELRNTQPQDVVLIYLAGHGENVNENWYFIPHELVYPEREDDVIAKAISSEELTSAIKNIAAQKILVLIDACKSGAVLLAFRGFEDRKALSQLSRATGVHVVAASAKDQFAAEVKDLGHGVFTYTLLEGLKGKAAGAGENVTVRKLMSYIEEQLPELTKKYRQEAQYPVVDSRGMDFPLVQGK